MDVHCYDISLGLYFDQNAYRIHTYSRRPEAAQRINFLTEAMALLGGMRSSNGWLCFPCGDPHSAAARRLFLEVSKLPTASPLSPRPLAVTDKKSGAEITVLAFGAGRYGLQGADPSRLDAIVHGFRKLAGAISTDTGRGEFAFPCGSGHDELVGLLLPRALNVRQVIREEEAAASKGVLVAPSAQK